MISIHNLTHIYHSKGRQTPCVALSNFDLNVSTGEFCILSGPNGSGKSTLFRILCGIMLPSNGSIVIGGHDLFRAPKMVRQIVGVVFQSPAVDKHLTVSENMIVHAALYSSLKNEATSIAEALEWTDLKNRLNQRVETLSGGLMRQLELAKCLSTHPQVLLLDEPTTGLDPVSRYSFLNVLKNIQRERGITVLMTTHIFAEAEKADRVVIMKDGNLLACDSPSNLRNHMGREMVVVVSTDPVTMATALKQEMGLRPLRFGDELRLESVEQAKSLQLLEEILVRYRPNIHSIAIKQAALEDVFIHLISNKQSTESNEDSVGRVYTNPLPPYVVGVW